MKKYKNPLWPATHGLAIPAYNVNIQGNVQEK
jgi:hypothetical protein